MSNKLIPVSLNVAPSSAEGITCASCEACCCRLEVILLTETGVPERFIRTDKWGAAVMRRLEDGWCAALDRNTMLCTIYDRRPLLCREYEAGDLDCLTEREGMGTVYLQPVR